MRIEHSLAPHICYIGADRDDKSSRKGFSADPDALMVYYNVRHLGEHKSQSATNRHRNLNVELCGMFFAL